MLNDEFGLMVYSDEPSPPLVVDVSAAIGFVSTTQERLEAALGAQASELPTTEAESTAFGLFSASFDAEPDARLVLLMMALEALIDQQPLDDNLGLLVDELIAAVQKAQISDSDRQSLLGSIGWLKYESVSRAGRRLVQTLADHAYGGLDPVSLFNKAYRVRNQLVHGHMPRPPRTEVGTLAANLEVMVGELIAGPDLVLAMRK